MEITKELMADAIDINLFEIDYDKALNSLRAVKKAFILEQNPERINDMTKLLAEAIDIVLDREFPDRDDDPDFDEWNHNIEDDELCNILGCIIENPNTSPETLHFICYRWIDYGMDVGFSLAGNPKTPPDVLDTILDYSWDYYTEDPQLILKVLSHPNTTPEILVSTLSDECPDNEFIRRYVASDERTPVPILYNLAADSSESVRDAAMTTLNKVDPFFDFSPTEAAIHFLQMTKDSELFVRRSLAANSHTPVLVLGALSFDEDDDVRRAVASNPRTPSIALDDLAHDENIYIASWATHQLQERNSSIKDPSVITNSAKQVAASQGSEGNSNHTIRH